MKKILFKFSGTLSGSLSTLWVSSARASLLWGTFPILRRPTGLFPSNYSNDFNCLIRFSILLPNKWNVSFYFPNVIRFYLLFGFFPMLYTQMWHMYQLRFIIFYVCHITILQFNQMLTIRSQYLLLGARNLESSNTSLISRNLTRFWWKSRKPCSLHCLVIKLTLTGT